MAAIRLTNTAGRGPKGMGNGVASEVATDTTDGSVGCSTDALTVVPPAALALTQAQNRPYPNSASGKVATPWAVAQARGLRSGWARSQSALRIGYQVQQATAPSASSAPSA